jgi:histone H1A, sperm
MVLCICSKDRSIKIKIEMEMINMNMKNTFKKMIAIIGIAGISIVSFAIPPKEQRPKPKATVVQPKRKSINKKPTRKQATNPQEKRINKKYNK